MAEGGHSLGEESGYDRLPQGPPGDVTKRQDDVTERRHDVTTHRDDVTIHTDDVTLYQNDVTMNQKDTRQPQTLPFYVSPSIQYDDVTTPSDDITPNPSHSVPLIRRPSDDVMSPGDVTTTHHSRGRHASSEDPDLRRLAISGDQCRKSGKLESGAAQDASRLSPRDHERDSSSDRESITTHTGVSDGEEPGEEPGEGPTAAISPPTPGTAAVSDGEEPGEGPTAAIAPPTPGTAADEDESRMEIAAGISIASREDEDAALAEAPVSGQTAPGSEQNQADVDNGPGGDNDVTRAESRPESELGCGPRNLVPRVLCRQTSRNSNVDFVRLTGSTNGSSISGQSLRIQEAATGRISLCGSSLYSADVGTTPQSVDDVIIDEHVPDLEGLLDPAPSYDYNGRSVEKWGCEPRARIIHHIASGNIYFLEEAGEGVAVKILAERAPINLSFQVCSDRNAHVTIAASGNNVVASVGQTVDEEKSKLIKYDLRGERLEEKESKDFIHIASVEDFIYCLCDDSQVHVYRTSELNYQPRIIIPEIDNITDKFRPWKISLWSEKGRISRFAILHLDETNSAIRIDIFDRVWHLETKIELSFDQQFEWPPSTIFVSNFEVLIHDGCHIYYLNFGTGTGSRTQVREGVLDFQNDRLDHVLVLTKCSIYRLSMGEMRIDCGKSGPKQSVVRYESLPEAEQRLQRSYTQSLDEESLQRPKQRRCQILHLGESDFVTVNANLEQMNLGNSMIVNWRRCIAAVAVSKTSGYLLTMATCGKVTIYGCQADRPWGRADLPLPQTQQNLNLRLATTDLGHYVVAYGKQLFLFVSEKLLSSKEYHEPIQDVVYCQSRIYALHSSVILVYNETLQYLTSFPGSDGSRRLAVHGDKIYIIHKENRSILRLDTTATHPRYSVFAINLLGPETLINDDQGYLIVGDRNDQQSRVAILAPSSGIMYTEISLPNSPILDIRLMDNGKLFIHLKDGLFISNMESQQLIADDAFSN